MTEHGRPIDDHEQSPSPEDLAILEHWDTLPIQRPVFSLEDLEADFGEDEVSESVTPPTRSQTPSIYTEPKLKADFENFGACPPRTAGDSAYSSPAPRWNWLWLAPIALFIFRYYLVRNVGNAWELIRSVIHRWDWGILISPAWAIFLGGIGFSLTYPLLASLTLYIVASEKQQSKLKKIGLVIAILIGLELTAITCEAVLWGSYPLELDSSGRQKLRLIPFLPWPERPYGEF